MYTVVNADRRFLWVLQRASVRLWCDSRIHTSISNSGQSSTLYDSSTWLICQPVLIAAQGRAMHKVTGCKVGRSRTERHFAMHRPSICSRKTARYRFTDNWNVLQIVAILCACAALCLHIAEYTAGHTNLDPYSQAFVPTPSHALQQYRSR